jgi:hypothetical protein
MQMDIADWLIGSERLHREARAVDDVTQRRDCARMPMHGIVLASSARATKDGRAGDHNQRCNRENGQHLVGSFSCRGQQSHAWSRRAIPDVDIRSRLTLHTRDRSPRLELLDGLMHARVADRAHLHVDGRSSASFIACAAQLVDAGCAAFQAAESRPSSHEAIADVTVPALGATLDGPARWRYRAGMGVVGSPSVHRARLGVSWIPSGM